MNKSWYFVWIGDIYRSIAYYDFQEALEVHNDLIKQGYENVRIEAI
jgi:hypothetical protein